MMTVSSGMEGTKVWGRKVFRKFGNPGPHCGLRGLAPGLEALTSSGFDAVS